jgi:lipopolysaccharide export system permease protein
MPGATSAAVTAQPEPEIERPTYSRVKEAKDQLGLARQARNKFEVEIHKKFALAAACVIFVLVGAPLALRFPRGGVGMVIGASLLIFAVSYVGLIGGEALADKALLSPFLAMWAANLILLVVGLLLTLRMGRENTSGRGGGFGEWLGGLRLRRRKTTARAVRTA